MPIDICGANALHSAFGDKAFSIFIDRPRPKVITSILERSVSNEEKAKRLISLEHEYANRSLCDLSLKNDGTIEESVQKIFQLFV